MLTGSMCNLVTTVVGIFVAVAIVTIQIPKYVGVVVYNIFEQNSKKT